jgi:hypothetical protein
LIFLVPPGGIEPPTSPLPKTWVDGSTSIGVRFAVALDAGVAGQAQMIEYQAAIAVIRAA